MEEFLKIAKESYPVGTVFKSAFDPQNTQIVEGNWEKVSNGIIVSPGATYIYFKEKWAEIISKPEVKEETMTLLEEAKKRFPIGTKFEMCNTNKIATITTGLFRDLGICFHEVDEEGLSLETDGFYHCVYVQGDWARIIEEPKTRIVEDPHSNATLVPGKARVVKVKDNINPSHYKNGKVECIDALESATVNKSGLEAVCTANVIKYLWRYEGKNGLEDVKKAQWYLEKLIKHLENGTPLA